MRRILTSFMIVSVLLALPLAPVVGANDEEFKFFKVKVKSSDNGEDFAPTTNGEHWYCFAFGSGGLLEVSSLNNGVLNGIRGSYAWDYKRLGTSKFGWQAVGVSNGSVGLSGYMGFLGLYGDGIDGEGTTYKLKGIRAKQCGEAGMEEEEPA